MDPVRALQKGKYQVLSAGENRLRAIVAAVLGVILLLFQVGLEATVAWYASHRDWWEPLKERAPVVETAWS